MSHELYVTLDFHEQRTTNVWITTGWIRLNPKNAGRKQYYFHSGTKHYVLDHDGQVDSFHDDGLNQLMGYQITWRFAGWYWEVRKIGTAVALALQQQKHRVIPQQLRNLVVFAVLDSWQDPVWDRLIDSLVIKK